MRAGLTIFLSMAYIVNVHPFILNQAGLNFNACVTSTVLICFFSSLTMSLYAKNPLAMAPGLGINAFFAYTMILQKGIPYETALGAVFWSGVLFLILSLFKTREWIFKKIPHSIKQSISAGIGLMIALVGFQQGGLIVSSENTLLQMAPFSWKSVWFIVALLITFFVVVRKIKGSFCLVIILVTLLSIPLGRWTAGPALVEYKGFFSWPDFSLIGKIDFLGSLHLSVLPSLLSLAFVDLLESYGTLMSVLGRFDLIEGVDRRPRRLKESLITDALATIYSAIFGSSSATAYVESAVGLKEGGRTGFCSLISAFLFLPFLFLSPLLSIIPDVAIAPVLVIVGVLMMEPVQHISWKNLDIAIPAFLTITLIPLTFSITNGIVWGVLSYFFIYLLKKIKRVQFKDK